MKPIGNTGEKNCTRIEDLRQRLVSCGLNCDGIRNEPQNGIMPRGIILDPDSSMGPDCIIVGINPGSSGKREREYFLKNGPSYVSLKRYFFDDAKIYRTKYYEELRNFAKEIGFWDAILWTDLCKCENRIKGKSPPLQTFRICVKKFLLEELRLFPKPTLIAVGNQAFEALSYMFPDRFIIGVPHPTGSYGHFARLFDGKRKLKSEYKKMAKIAKDKHGNANSVKIFPPL